MYQTGSKFRAEMKPRFGLIRSNEFIMKDLYTFDKNTEAAKNTYQEVNLSPLQSTFSEKSMFKLFLLLNVVLLY